jgi:hypothetical protein
MLTLGRQPSFTSTMRLQPCTSNFGPLRVGLNWSLGASGTTGMVCKVHTVTKETVNNEAGDIGSVTKIVLVSRYSINYRETNKRHTKLSSTSENCP